MVGSLDGEQDVLGTGEDQAVGAGKIRPKPVEGFLICRVGGCNQHLVLIPGDRNQKAIAGYWQYEQEYRAFVSLEEEIDGYYFKDFSPELRLRAVIVGVQSKVTQSRVASALHGVETAVDVFKARASFKSFEMVRNKNRAMWT